MIDILFQPFYGGKKHRVAAEVLSPSKKAILSIAGEWNGVMVGKWANGKQETFVDTKNIEIIKKRVSPVAEQEEFESRKLWREVTRALKEANVDMATSEKFKIEQRQRELVKERLQSGVKWQTRVSCLVILVSFDHY